MVQRDHLTRLEPNSAVRGQAQNTWRDTNSSGQHARDSLGDRIERERDPRVNAEER